MSNWETVVNKKKSHVTKADVRRVKKKFVEGDSVPKIEKQGNFFLQNNVLKIFAVILFISHVRQNILVY